MGELRPPARRAALGLGVSRSPPYQQKSATGRLAELLCGQYAGSSHKVLPLWRWNASLAPQPAVLELERSRCAVGAQVQAGQRVDRL